MLVQALREESRGWHYQLLFEDQWKRVIQSNCYPNISLLAPWVNEFGEALAFAFSVVIVLEYLILDYTFRALSNALSFVNFTWGLFSLQHCLKPLSHSIIPDWICLVIYVLAFRDISFSQSLCIGSRSSSKVLIQSWNASKAGLAASWHVILRKNIVPRNILFFCA